MTKKNEAKVEQQKMPSETQHDELVEGLIQYARDHQGLLALRDFGPEKTDELEATLLTNKKDRKRYLAARGREAKETRALRAVLGEALDLRQELNLTFRMAKKHLNVTPPPVRKRTALGKSPKRCLAWMREEREAIIEFFAVSPATGQPARFESMESKLTAALLSQQEAQAELKASAKTLAASRSGLAGLVEMLRVAGRIAFKHQPELLKPLRSKAGRRSRKKGTEAEAPRPTPKAGATPPPGPTPAADPTPPPAA